MNPYQIAFDPRATQDGAKLSASVRRRILEKLDFLRATPFRSHPGVLIKEVAELRGVWRFHVAPDVRVLYTVMDDVLWVVMIERSAGVMQRTFRELRQRI